VPMILKRRIPISSSPFFLFDLDFPFLVIGGATGLLEVLSINGKSAQSL
jgi:hypothetical protein